MLETGVNTATKRAVVQQLGEVQRLYPHELHHLLAKVSVLLRSVKWDTRIAAANAIAAILSQVPQWDPIPIVKNEGILCIDFSNQVIHGLLN